MKVIIRVETVTDWGESDTVELSHLERPCSEHEPEKVGLALAEGKDLLHKLQQIVVAAQSEVVPQTSTRSIPGVQPNRYPKVFNAPPIERPR
jgi:hypothetical protein